MSAFSSNVFTSLDRQVTSEKNTASKSSDELDEYYELNKCAEWIKKNNLKKVCLQFPDEMLHEASDVVLHLESRIGYLPFILGDTTYASCCLDMNAARHVGSDGLIHFGHACLSPPTVDKPILFVYDKKAIDLDEFMAQFKNTLQMKEEPLLLLYDVSYEHAINSIKEGLTPEYPNLIVPACDPTSSRAWDTPCTNAGSPVPNELNLLGRKFTLPAGLGLESYTLVFIGKDGPTLFNIILTFPVKMVYIYNPASPKKTNNLEKYIMQRSKFMMRRIHLIEKVKDAKSIGIITGTVGVASYVDAMRKIAQLIKSRGKKYYNVSVGKPNCAKLANLPEIDIFVLVACTETSLLDSKEFYKPIVTPFELELALNSNRTLSDKYILEFQRLLEGGSDYIEATENADDGYDVSLVTGQMRTMTTCESKSFTSSAIAEKTDGSLISSTSASDKSWFGLRPNLGQDEVALASKGRSGIAANYDTDHDALSSS